ncbi:uroporphyrinogen-III synthase [Rhizoctonia solani]|uniref:Uroporphyrinogen-III synthase n=1 Tax=Rhizoctonia solani TaxID=456999 RepID=A0A8H8NY21_9AGAM|nr:uroporphyrinogen-III synthase [Rhizoctonia solani]QRW20132.1 uroporphyrinogen-III synthase [Rhizoctonia solani]
MLNHVLLLKNPDESSRPISVRALTEWFYDKHHIYSNPFLHRLDGLTDIIAQEGEKYGGVIVTSGRAVDAWGNAAKEVQEQGKLSFPLHCPTDTHLCLYSSVVCDREPFIMGFEAVLCCWLKDRKKASWLKWLNASPSRNSWVPRSLERASCSPSLCIDYPTRSRQSLPLLYLTGDKNAGGVGKGLKAGGLGFKMVQVYETSASTTFEEDFEEGVKEGSE